VGASLRFLPPYNPDFNPIEQAFAKLKAFLRAARPRTFDHVTVLVRRAVGLVIGSLYGYENAPVRSKCPAGLQVFIRSSNAVWRVERRRNLRPTPRDENSNIRLTQGPRTCPTRAGAMPFGGSRVERMEPPGVFSEALGRLSRPRSQEAGGSRR
jgi:hypothetical protein